MSAASSQWSADQFLCSICLDLFTDPVTTSCGHNFCRTCISQYWDVHVPHKCPMCKEHFFTRPHLKVNTLLSEMVDRFRHEAQQKPSSSSGQPAAKPGEVPCDVCTGTKLKALKSCMVCLLSYCQTHLEPHLTAPRLKKHQLMEPVENLEDRMCLQHDKPLELFCRTDQTCVCLICPVLDHKNHKFVPLGEEAENKKSELRKTEADVQKMIQNRKAKIQEIQASVRRCKDAAEREKAEGVELFTALKESVEKGLKELVKEIEDKQKTAEKEAEDLLKDLEKEISQLVKRSSEMKQLSQAEDHFHFLQTFSSLKAPSPVMTLTKVRVHPPSYEGAVERAVAQLERKIREEMEKRQFKAEMKGVQKYAADLLLNPNTKNPELTLPDGSPFFFPLSSSDFQENWRVKKRLSNSREGEERRGELLDWRTRRSIIE